MSNPKDTTIVLDQPWQIELYQMQSIYHVLMLNKNPLVPEAQKRLAANMARKVYGCKGRLRSSLASQMLAQIHEKQAARGLALSDPYGALTPSRSQPPSGRA
jgi:hypothetical protein